jgi:hypothetical protein
MRLFPGLLGTLGPQIPLIVVWFVGIILALVYWKRHPAVSFLMLASMVLLIISALFNVFMVGILPVSFGINMRSLSMVLGIGRVFNVIVEISAWIMLIIALFGWRKTSAPK